MTSRQRFTGFGCSSSFLERKHFGKQRRAVQCTVNSRFYAFKEGSCCCCCRGEERKNNSCAKVPRVWATTLTESHLSLKPFCILMHFLWADNLWSERDFESHCELINQISQQQRKQRALKNGDFQLIYAINLS